MVSRAMQVNIHPNDVGHVAPLLAHQIAVWGGQVDRIHVTLDLHGSAGGHYRADALDQKLRRMRETLAAIQQSHRSVVVDEVDLSPAMRREVARFFFGREDTPNKAWNGSPLFPYLYGLYKADADYVVHFDGDMFFGGGSQVWLDEAVRVLETTPDCVFVGPLPGPPHKDERLIGQGDNWQGVTVSRAPGVDYGFAFNTVSSRIFVTSPALLKARAGGRLEWLPPSRRQRLHARLLGNPPQSRELEAVLSRTMSVHGLSRIDFLGSGAGMWSLHPPHRPPEFFARLPELIDRVERGDIPDAQRGRYDFDDSLLDCREARRKNRRQERWKRHARTIASRAFAMGSR